ncbi:MauE/DoxX family redox-associated membrane protein [Pedobacter nototheniae]|uniref:MauE/DoxX family redox-associated membrane protein n=1 Tax=Pedobacter nototheniae TaxID=2488994 RepID=UPI00293088A2|nr:MauE/DoxX family redox-associated membrane protein [Pedobacter nototheniae]
MKRKILSLNQIFNSILFLLVLLWTYTLGSKLANFDTFRHELSMQHLPRPVLKPLSYALPVSELIVVILLIIPGTRKSGLICSITLFIIFTVYILLILLNYFKSTPCSCGGVLKVMSWKTHFLFNLFFIVINAVNLSIFNKIERRLKAK